MRIAPGPSEYEILALIHAVGKDRNSWENWRALRIETQALCGCTVKNSLHAGIRRILEIYLKEKHGTAFLCGFGAVHIFCKDVPAPVLDTMAHQIQELVSRETGNNARYSLLDIFRDHERFMETYNYAVPAQNGQPRQEPANEQAPPAARRALRLNDRKVLLVEDDPVTRWMVRTALRDECTLSTAQDAGKAIAAYQNCRPDMVLLDINLPGKDGREVMAGIMRSDPGAYIVMFSSHDSLENIVDAIEEGAHGFIAKPFSREKLLHYVQECPAPR